MELAWEMAKAATYRHTDTSSNTSVEKTELIKTAFKSLYDLIAETIEGDSTKD